MSFLLFFVFVFVVLCVFILRLRVARVAIAMFSREDSSKAFFLSDNSFSLLSIVLRFAIEFLFF